MDPSSFISRDEIERVKKHYLGRDEAKIEERKKKMVIRQSDKYK